MPKGLEPQRPRNVIRPCNIRAMPHSPAKPTLENENRHLLRTMGCSTRSTTATGSDSGACFGGAQNSCPGNQTYHPDKYPTIKTLVEKQTMRSVLWRPPRAPGGVTPPRHRFEKDPASTGAG